MGSTAGREQPETRTQGGASGKNCLLLPDRHLPCLITHVKSQKESGRKRTERRRIKEQIQIWADNDSFFFFVILLLNLARDATLERKRNDEDDDKEKQVERVERERDDE